MLVNYFLEGNMTQHLRRSDLDFSTLAEETPARQDLVFAHIKSLDPIRDDEEPVAYAGWVFTNGLFRFPSSIYLPPHQVYLAWLGGTDQLVDLAGLVPDDQGVAKDEGLAEEDKFFMGFFGGHNVHPQYRGQGIGTLMIEHRVQALQNHVNSTRRPASVYAFFTNPTSGRNLENAGFENRGQRYIKREQKTEWLFRLQVNPN